MDFNFRQIQALHVGRGLRNIKEFLCHRFFLQLDQNHTQALDPSSKIKTTISSLDNLMLHGLFYLCTADLVVWITEVASCLQEVGPDNWTVQTSGEGVDFGEPPLPAECCKNVSLSTVQRHA